MQAKTMQLIKQLQDHIRELHSDQSLSTREAIILFAITPCDVESSHSHVEGVIAGTGKALESIFVSVLEDQPDMRIILKRAKEQIKQRKSMRQSSPGLSMFEAMLKGDGSLEGLRSKLEEMRDQLKSGKNQEKFEPRNGESYERYMERMFSSLKH